MTETIRNNDGSRDVITRNAAGMLVDQLGFRANGTKAYHNAYDAAGTLVLQEGFDTAGILNISIAVARDGSKTVELLTGGSTTRKEVYDTSQALAQVTDVAADGSKTVNDYSAGKLVKQIGYDARGLKFYTNFYDETGRLAGQYGYDSAGNNTLIITHGLDHTRHIQTLASDGHVTSQTGYDAQGRKFYTNFFDDTGRLAGQYGYDAGGNNRVIITHNVDGTTHFQNLATNGKVTDQIGYDAQGRKFYANYFDETGRLAGQYGCDSAGHEIVRITYFPDGTRSINNLNAAGASLDQTGYDSSGNPAYKNVFDSAGHMVEQMSFGPNGKVTLLVQTPVDGNKVVRHYDTNGTTTQLDTYRPNGSLTQVVIYSEGLTSTISDYDTNGVLQNQTGYAGTGLKAFTNTYATSGATIQQEGYDAAGNLILKISQPIGAGKTVTKYDAGGHVLSTDAYATDGSHLLSVFKSSGVPVSTNAYDASGTMTEAKTFDANGILATRTIANASGALTTQYDMAGHITQELHFDRSGVLVSKIVNTANGHSEAIYQNGHVSQLQEYDAGGHKTNVTNYDDIGKLKDQTGYDAAGNKILLIKHVDDGSTIVTRYDVGGHVRQLDTYDASGKPIAHTIYDIDGNIQTSINSKPFNDSGHHDPLDLSKFVLTFDDEFNTIQTSSDGSAGWRTTMANGSRSFNETNFETQYYTDSTVGRDPFSTNNGILNIHAQKAVAEDLPTSSNLTWTSGTLTTERSFSQLHGYFEIRAKLPAGTGMWPAFWMMPANGQWPPELDVMEMLGNDPTKIYSTTHTMTTGEHTLSSASTVMANTSTDFHTYGVNWQADTIAFYVDGVPTATIATPADMSTAMYMIVNLAIGGAGSWPGLVDAGLVSADMQVDYVRAYRLASAASDTAHAKITAAAGQTVLNGLAGDDTLLPGPGSHQIDGGVGNDTIVYMKNFEAATITLSADGKWAVSSSDGADQIANVEVLQFWNGKIILSSQAYDIYDTTGSLLQTVRFSASGLKTSVDFFDASGRVIQEDQYGPAGYRTQNQYYAADGSLTVSTYAATGVIVSQTGYDANKNKVYANSYQSDGSMSDQKGFASSTGVQNYQKAISTDGSSIVSHWDSISGQLTSVEKFSSGNARVEMTAYAADGSSTLTTYDQAGHTLSQAGFAPNKAPTYANLYDVSGNLIDQKGFDSNSGVQNYGKVVAVDGSSIVKHWDSASGKLTSVEKFSSGNARVEMTAYAADGSSTLATYDQAGHTLSQAGFTANKMLTYANFYDGSGNLIDQKGFDSSSGIQNYEKIVATDGSFIVKHWDAISGQLTSVEKFSSGNARVEMTTYAGDGSSTLATYDQAGHTLSQTGFTANKIPTYANLYDVSGKLIEQNGFDGMGHRTLNVAYDTDGTRTSSQFDGTGTLTSRETYDGNGKLLVTANLDATSHAYSIVGHADGVRLVGTSGNDTFRANGSSDTFVFKAGFGHDTIVDFAASGSKHDFIEFDKSIFSDYAHVMNAAHDVSNGLDIAAGGANVLTIIGIDKSMLDAGLFHFV